MQRKCPPKETNLHGEPIGSAITNHCQHSPQATKVHQHGPPDDVKSRRGGPG